MKKSTNLKTITVNVLSVLLPLGIGGISSMVTRPAVTSWYVYLDKPFFTPPNWIFAPVWTLLYVLMGLAAARVWTTGKHHLWGKTALYHYGVQLLFNGLWSLVFFGLKAPKLGMFVIVILFILIERTIYWFKLVDRTAAYFLYPYLIWVTYAALLNGGIAFLN